MTETKTPNQFCENCGELLSLGARFCEACGTPIAYTSEPARSSLTVPPKGEKVKKLNHKAFIGGGLLVLLAVVCLLVWHQSGIPNSANGVNSAGQSTQQNTVPNTPAIASNPVTSAVPDKKADSGNGKTSQPDLTNPLTYLPQLNQKYYYYQYYPDGDEGEIQMVAAKAASGTLVSTVEFIQSKLYADQSIFTQHYLTQADGIYIAKDETDYLAELWLKNNLTVGQEWNVAGIPVKIRGMGVVCDLGFIKIENCLVIEKHYTAVSDHVDTIYIAPGFGEVMIKTSDNGVAVKKLTKVTPIDETTAADIIRKNSLHLDSFK